MKTIISYAVFTIMIAGIFPAIAQDLVYPKHSSGFLSAAEEPVRTELDILSYNIHIRIDPAKKSITGSNFIKINVLENIPDFISLDLAGLSADSVLISGQPVSFTQSSDQLDIELSEPVRAGDSLAIKVFYSGKPLKGLYLTVNSYGDTVIYSHNEPYDARYWFPCNDHPADKALLEMNVDLPAGYKVLGNGDLVGNEGLADNWQRSSWHESFPVATYLISIAAARYELVNRSHLFEEDSLLLQYYVYPQDRAKAVSALQSTAEIVDFFSGYTAPYPFYPEKYAMSAVPFGQAAAMENQTATTMRDLILDNENVIAHELAHQWWGDALTPVDFKDIWLNEGFASYFDALFTEHKYGPDVFTERMSEYRNYIFQDGSLDYPILDPPPQYLFGRAVYFKGAWVLHMLRNRLGDELFQEITRQYYQMYRYKNVTTADLISVCNQTAGEDLNPFFDQWLNYGGIPELNGRWEQLDGNVVLEISQTGNPSYRFDLDIRIDGVDSDTMFTVNFSRLIETYNLPYSGTVDQILIDPDNKILQTNNSPLYLLPPGTELGRTFPNPFSGEVTIEYLTDRPQEVRFVFFDLNGRKVDEITQRTTSSGVKQVFWSGKGHASGIYFFVMYYAESMETRKIILLK